MKASERRALAAALDAARCPVCNHPRLGVAGQSPLTVSCGSCGWSGAALASFRQQRHAHGVRTVADVHVPWPLDVEPHRAQPARQRAHRHSVQVDGRFALTDRCQSAVLWATVARAVVQGRPVQVDGQAVHWPAAREWLDTLSPAMRAKWTAGLDVQD